MADTLNPVEISVVVPLHNEEGAVANLAREIATALDGFAYEMIFVDDCSRDKTRMVLNDLKAGFPQLRALSHRANAGQSRAIASGVRAAKGAIIATLDGDGQNDPADLPRLIARLARADAPSTLGLVQGRRTVRKDSAAKRVASRVANTVRKQLLGDGADDSGCGIKAFKRDTFLRLPYFDHMHRYMPALFLRDGSLVEYLDVNHRARETGASKYTNLSRLAAALTDLIGVSWLRSRHRHTGGVDEV
jgi:dolichol-phosphate mannosyltransferase